MHHTETNYCVQLKVSSSCARLHAILIRNGAPPANHVGQSHHIQVQALHRTNRLSQIILQEFTALNLHAQQCAPQQKAWKQQSAASEIIVAHGVLSRPCSQQKGVAQIPMASLFRTKADGRHAAPQICKSKRHSDGKASRHAIHAVVNDNWMPQMSVLQTKRGTLMCKPKFFAGMQIKLNKCYACLLKRSIAPPNWVPCSL